MMLKEKSSKWARLKLLLLLPLGALAVLAFARPEVNEPPSSSVDNESTINSGENEIVQSFIKQYDNEKGVVVFHSIDSKYNLLFYYPTAYDEANEGEKPIRDNFVKYVIENIEYTRNDFEKLVKGKMLYKNKVDIKPKDAEILEFYCITQKGLKTPTWYMAKPAEGKIFVPLAFTRDKEPILSHEITLRDKDTKPKNTVKFVPPVVKKDK